MIRFLILSGYFELMLMLQVTGKLNQYINTHYSYLAFLSMVLAFILSVTQLIKWVRNKKSTHSHFSTKKSLLLAYLITSIPLFVGFCFPTVSLDASIVDTKGFHFPLAKESTGDAQIRTQYLRPDTSIYYNKNDYTDLMTKIKNKYIDKGTIKVTDENYLELMEIIYNYPGEFIGKNIQYTGFFYQDPEKKANYGFLFRFGIIHCIADSGVFGLLNSFPTNVPYKTNEWVHVSGKIELEHYKPFNRNLPTVVVTKAEKTVAPHNQYVYRSF
ncbi:MAG: TIGR03943 family protein [Streptococcaceae bacterium]|jgi:putative membrane protein|nr:TIGR03943 family protein [Streptococcaceae bacterium]